MPVISWKDLDTRITALEEHLAPLQADVATFQTDVAILQADVATLKETNTNIWLTTMIDWYIMNDLNLSAKLNVPHVKYVGDLMNHIEVTRLGDKVDSILPNSLTMVDLRLVHKYVLTPQNVLCHNFPTSDSVSRYLKFCHPDAIPSVTKIYELYLQRHL